MRRIHLQPCGNFRERYDQEMTIFSTDFGRLWAGIGLMILFLECLRFQVLRELVLRCFLEIQMRQQQSLYFGFQTNPLSLQLPRL